MSTRGKENIYHIPKLMLKVYMWRRWRTIDMSRLHWWCGSRSKLSGLHAVKSVGRY